MEGLRKVSSYRRGEYSSEVGELRGTEYQELETEEEEPEIDLAFKIVFGEKYNEAFNVFYGIQKPNGESIMSTMTDIVEVINMCIQSKDAKKVVEQLEEISTLPDVTIPWDLPSMKPYYEERYENIKYEQFKPEGILRPDGSKCPSCGSNRYYEERMKQTRSADEEIAEGLKRCAGSGCGKPIKGFIFNSAK